MKYIIIISIAVLAGLFTALVVGLVTDDEFTKGIFAGVILYFTQDLVRDYFKSNA